ncbi:DUF5007 domain-containing protein [Flavobacterium hiemivividum]|uniref:DUF5007 domain-containing protein n=1 Tax=Flavobacterium hiemivividum TaxID=2541734 RepID=A0A4V2Z0Q2_9FLAO|nr:DUF5007 domain-containing protein [Flavobacterium hiemivividum]TDE01918.1 DUF5007 domain-containing protein [Flavobacterium hiemivividum]
MKKIIYFLMITVFVSSCEQPEVGYISDNIHSLQDNIDVPRGVFITSPPPASEGSTYPLEWKITSITDKDGKVTTELQEEHDILTWLKPFDPNTDTTLELAMKKLEISKQPSILMNPVSGQFAFTQATRMVVNDDFDVNVNVKNVRGERQLDKFTHIKLRPFKQVEFPTEMRSRLQLGKGAGVWDIGSTYTVLNDNDPEVPKVLNGTSRYITIKKVSDEPKQAIKVKMIIADSYGVALDPSKVLFYPDGASYLQNYHDNSIGVVNDAEGSTFGLPAPPFPQYGRTYSSGTNSYLMYYLTTDDAFTVDKVAYEADNGLKNWSAYIDPSTGEIRNRAYIRWGVKINDTGTWEIKMKIPYTKKK